MSGCKITDDNGTPIDPISGNPIPEFLKITVKVGADTFCFDIREFWGRYETRQYVTFKKGWAFFPASWQNKGIKNPTTNIPFTIDEMIQIYKQIHRDNLMVTDTFGDDVFWMANSPRHIGELRRILKSKFPFLGDDDSTELVLSIQKNQNETGKKIKGIFCVGVPMGSYFLNVSNIPFINDLESRDKDLYLTIDAPKDLIWRFYKI